MRAFFIVTAEHMRLKPELPPSETSALMESVDVCLVSTAPPKLGDTYTGEDGSQWRVLSVDDNGRTADVETA